MSLLPEQLPVPDNVLTERPLLAEVSPASKLAPERGLFLNSP